MKLFDFPRFVIGLAMVTTAILVAHNYGGSDDNLTVYLISSIVGLVGGYIAFPNHD